MDNSMDNLLDTYLFETNSLLDQTDEILINAEKNGNFTQDDVNEIFRSMHTIKGSSAMLEFNSLMTIAHHIEDLFYYIRENGTDGLDADQKSELFNLMFKSTDMLRDEIQKVENNEPLTDNIEGITEEINNFLAKISGGAGKDAKSGSSASKGDPSSPSSEPAQNADSGLPGPVQASPFAVRVFFDAGCGMENLRAYMLQHFLQENGLEGGCYPEHVDSDPDTAGLIVKDGFYLLFSTRKDADKAAELISQSANISSYEVLETAEWKKEAPAQEKSAAASAQSAQAAGKTEQSDHPYAPSHPAPAKKAAGSASGTAKQNLINVSLSKLNNLMALVGEIVITESMLVSSPDLKNLKLDNFMKSARQLRKLTDDLQDISMSLRMVSVSSVFQRMNRIVRDMKKDLNKDVRLTVIGEDTEVDKSIVDNISDPIMHIVRNSMDHGIEDTAEERIAAGKDPQGEIILSAEHTGNEIILSVSDDGRGMDPNAILAKAEKHGLLTKPKEEYSQKEILSLLMLPGFSTNTTVTEYSGRGVGLDVVKRNVEALGGTVIITSEKGKGSSTTLKLPLTLSIVDGMELSVGESIFTIPVSNIRQTFQASEKDITFDTENHEMIRCLDHYYPLVRIAELFGIQGHAASIEEGLLMWVEASDLSYCIFIDELIGEQQVVVKPVPAYLGRFGIKDSGISGCTILGDGNISIILDVANVYQAFQRTL
ncbi:MAG TPA: chemotaxis protein CheA [Candidatus Eisenbergiella merdipullorum]|uniref:Chemotaxis protein CheA n=1 Tax=Candidatus Eisenbergiella merdipullorum TaxID=2838553 RepID=A0A9D2L1G1_9FIRM|nr:chemotaxis protein CheA [Candidatus Eisenbergiella merdipullorum]